MQHTGRILIVGGGSGGISVAARLKRMGLGPITLVEPAQEHYYQPLWTLCGVGLVPREKTARREEDVIPAGVQWIKDRAVRFEPAHNQVITEKSGALTYDALVVATGLDVNFELIQGLNGHLGQNGLCSVYQYDQLPAAAKMIREWTGGTAIFTMPPVPIKCAGAPQKVMYLADRIWRDQGVRDKSKVVFATAGATIFGVKPFADALMQVVRRKEIDLWLQHKLVEVRPQDKIAVFEATVPTPGGSETSRFETPYDLLHVVPPMSAPKVIRESPLASTEAGQLGWLAVDKHTLQHKTFPNIFGIGDVTGIPNSKTGAAVRKEAPVVAHNIRALLQGQPLWAGYDGYASCPLITDIGKVMLAEFGYDGKLMPTFPLDPTKERRLYWHLKKDLLPPMYWHGMLKGLL